MSYIKLPANNTSARQRFTQSLEKPDTTIVLIFWDDDMAKNAREFAQQLADHPDFEMVDFIETQDPGILHLDQLPNSAELNLDNLENFIALSIAPGNQELSYLVSRAKFQQAPGYIRTAVVKALANAD